jgi:hypothetical protein
MVIVSRVYDNHPLIFLKKVYMVLRCLQTSDEWDAPAFKVLAPNDTGASKGNQAGFVVPVKLQEFFPTLVDTTSPTNPSVSHRISSLNVWHLARLTFAITTGLKAPCAKNCLVRNRL